MDTEARPDGWTVEAELARAAFAERLDADSRDARPELDARTALAWCVGLTAFVLVGSPLLSLLTGSPSAYAIPVVLALYGAWIPTRMTLSRAGLNSGAGFYRPATLHAFVVAAFAAWLAASVGATSTSDAQPLQLVIQVATMWVVTLIGAFLVEDGFFRGSLWGLLERADYSPDAILLWTSGLAALWYTGAAWMEGWVGGPESALILALNVLLLGINWGYLRYLSGSLLPVVWAHAVWNGVIYTLFGFGTAGGALGIADWARLGPERGWVGVALNAAWFLMIRHWSLRRSPAADPAA